MICIQHLVVKRTDHASCSSSDYLRKEDRVPGSNSSPFIFLTLVKKWLNTLSSSSGGISSKDLVSFTDWRFHTFRSVFVFFVVFTVRSCFVQCSLKYRRLGGCLLQTCSSQTGQNLAKILHFRSQKLSKLFTIFFPFCMHT